MKITEYPSWWKILELVSQNYWWSQIFQYIGQYVSICNLCLRMKPIQYPLVGKLHPLPILET